MDDIDSVSNGANEDDCDSDLGDPFVNCRLSEVVANMLSRDDDSNSGVNETEPDTYEIKTAFIDYIQEPRNKELFRETLRCVDDLDSDHKTFDLTEEFVDISSPIESIRHPHSLSDSNIVFDDNLSVFDDSVSVHRQNVRTTVGRSIETVFGVKSHHQDSEDTTIEDKVRMETEFGPNKDLRNSKYRWSVTSV